MKTLHHNGRSYEVIGPFHPSEAPTREGVYLRHFQHSWAFSYWSPKYGWGFFGDTPEIAEKNGNIRSTALVPWYGCRRDYS